MDVAKIGEGKNFPYEFNVIIEIPAHAPPVKYEVEKSSGAIFVDRFINVPMFYPCNYGFIPATLAADNDPLDALVLTPTPLQPGAVIPSRPLGALSMTDEAGFDLKVLAVPTLGKNSGYDHISSYQELPKELLDQIVHFFDNYKKLEANKWVKIDGWEETDKACDILRECRDRAQASDS